MPIALTMALEVVAVTFGGLSVVAALIALLFGNKKILQRDVSSDLAELLESKRLSTETVAGMIRIILPSLLSAAPVIYGALVGMLMANALSLPLARTVGSLMALLGL